MRHLHLFGAPGAGVTTLGKALADRLGFAHFDTDDFYWFTGDARPYSRKRNPDHRRRELATVLDAAASGWVLSGSLCGWGDVFVPRFHQVVYVWAPVEVRMSRIRTRELARYGPDRLAEGGDLHLVFHKFLDWAAAYDVPSDNPRSRDQELKWLQNLDCPKLRLESEMMPEVSVEAILSQFSRSVSPHF